MEDVRSKINRRDFFKLGSVCLAGKTLTTALTYDAAEAASPSVSPRDLKGRLRGPILSIPTTYASDFSVDYTGTQRMIEKAAKAGVRVFALTAGNNQYDRLTHDEIKQLTKVMVETVAGRGMTIAATGPWWTGPAVDYARYAEAVGADAVQVLNPAEGDIESWFRHYKTVAEATRLGIVVHGAMTLPLIKRLAEIDSIVAMKAEFTVAQTASFYEALKGRWNIFQGGQKSSFLAFVPYGMQAYYSTFSSFAPEAAMDFWNIFKTNDIRKAGDWVLKYDVPFFEKWSHPFWRATLEHFGIASRYLRPPEQTFSDAQMAEVRSFYDGLGLGPKSA